MMLFALACAGVVYAYPTLAGPTGMLVIPTGKIPPTGLQIAGDWYQLEHGDSVPVRALMTIGRGLEVGAMYDPFNAEAPLNQAWSANAKASFARILGGDSAFGVIVRRDRDQQKVNTNYVQGYFAWSTDFDADKIDYSNIAFTAGVNWTRMKVGDEKAEYALRAFSGATLYLTPQWLLMGEFQTKNTRVGDLEAMTAIGMRYRLNTDISIQVGQTNALGLTAIREHKYFAGLNLTLPVKAQ